jgi:hypothetical protein
MPPLGLTPHAAAAIADDAEALAFAGLYAAAPQPLQTRLGLRIDQVADAGAVRTSHRRRGGQGALMARRIADAVAAGARYLVTETGEPMADEPNPSLANMKRCGFVTVASRLNFVGPA